jgi:3-hydroxyisobutyrate dehydrogenase-like beta-hydroxyacid dehydrogenase
VKNLTILVGGKKAKEDSVQRALKAMGAKCTEDID